MKIIPPADEEERRLWHLRWERDLLAATGERRRVQVIKGRYGWYARTVPLPRPKKRPRVPRQ